LWTMSMLLRLTISMSMEERNGAGLGLIGTEWIKGVGSEGTEQICAGLTVVQEGS